MAFEYLDGGLFGPAPAGIALPAIVDKFLRVLYTGTTTGTVAFRSIQDVAQYVRSSSLQNYAKGVLLPAEQGIVSSTDAIKILQSLLDLGLDNLLTQYGVYLPKNVLNDFKIVITSNKYSVVQRLGNLVLLNTLFLTTLIQVQLSKVGKTLEQLLAAKLGKKVNKIIRSGSTAPVPKVATHVRFVPFEIIGGVEDEILVPFTVEIRDNSEELVTTYSGSVTITLTGDPGNLTGTTTVAALSGVATFSDLVVDTPGTFQFIASSGTLIPETSDNFVITSGACIPSDDSLSFSVQPTNVTRTAGGGGA